MGAAWEYGPKVWKTLMSIEISRYTEKRSERTLMSPAAAATHARDRPSHYGHPPAPVGPDRPIEVSIGTVACPDVSLPDVSLTVSSC